MIGEPGEKMPSTIRFVNATGADIAVKNAVAPSLDQEYWSSIASDAPYSPSPTDVLKFDREEGIKDGHTWIFTTSVELDGVPIKLEEKLEGKFLHSDLSQQMSAGSTSTGFQNTDDDKSISFIGASGTEYSLS